MSRARALAALAPLAVVVLASSCPSDAVDGGTGISLTVDFDASLALDQLTVSFGLAGAPAFAPVKAPDKAKKLDPAATVVDVLLPSSLAGKTIAVGVDGFRAGALRASGDVSVALVDGKKVAAVVHLKAPESCGDGALREGIEACDDQNTADGDGCSSSCAVEPGFTCTGSPSTCTAPDCGDGAVEAGEGCDDRNTGDGDGCSSSCTVEPGYACTGEPSTCAQTCGDGALDAGEACDDQNTDDGDGCSSSCAVEPGFVCSGIPSTCAHTCGDGALDAGEACDDHNTAAGDGCSPSCAVEPGFVCAGTPSVCSETCGNRRLDAGETCDDGNLDDGDGCSSLCAQEPGFTCTTPGAACAPLCGDGLVRGGEGCDDGGTAADDGCSSSCAVEAGFACVGEPSTCSPACVIAGAVVPPGAVDPANPCRACDPAANPGDYSARGDGSVCDDGSFCNGADTCASGQCTGHAGSPCGGTTPACDEPSRSCLCSGGSCDDGAFCNGVETCGQDGACAAGTPPACGGATPECNEVTDQCVQCLDDGDCTADPQNPSCFNGTCVCAGCGCPFGQHDGGDGACVPAGACSPGFARAFTDGDGDGFGAGGLSESCFPDSPFPAGLSADGSDCDDGDGSVFRIQHVFPDADGDGFTAAGADVCVGATLPATLQAQAQPPPFMGYDALAASSSGGFAQRSWSNTSRAEVVDGSSATADGTPFFGAQTSQRLVVSHYDVRVPPGATVTGVEVHVFRKSFGGGNNDTVVDSSVKLTVDGTAASGTEHALVGSWPNGTITEAVYGGPTDTWGLTITPDTVNATGFGVVLVAQLQNGISAAVDGIVVRVFTDETSRVDCDDGDGTVFSTVTNLRTDSDGDRFTTGGDQTRCAGGTAPAKLIQTRNSGDDCFDQNASAHPGQNQTFSRDRGDGSFDYNCDGSITKSPSSVTRDTSCACDATPACVSGGTATTNTSSVSCGSSVADDSCGGDCTVDPNTCVLSPGSTTVRCR